MKVQLIHDKLAYFGEQVISFLDEIVRTDCPKCGLSELNISLIGKSLIIRCSEALTNYSDESEISIPTCDFIKTVRPVRLDNIDFSNTSDKRATAQNRKPTRKRVVRK